MSGCHHDRGQRSSAASTVSVHAAHVWDDARLLTKTHRLQYGRLHFNVRFGSRVQAGVGGVEHDELDGVKRESHPQLARHRTQIGEVIGTLLHLMVQLWVLGMGGIGR